MPRNRGFSLIELMVGLALSVALGLAMLTMTKQFLEWNANLGLLMDRDQRTRQGPLLLSRHLAAAGNNRRAGAWEGLRWAAGELRLSSDITGDEGFPDDRLADAFESVTLRRSSDQLQIRSGRAGYQPLLKNVREFRVEEWSPPLLRLRVEFETEGKLRGVETKLVEPVELNFQVWNYRPNWFEETRP